MTAITGDGITYLDTIFDLITESGLNEEVVAGQIRAILDRHSPAGFAVAERTGALLANITDALACEAGGFTCQEADAVVELLNLYGIDSTYFAAAHARSDEATDSHYQEGPP